MGCGTRRHQSLTFKSAQGQISAGSGTTDSVGRPTVPLRRPAPIFSAEFALKSPAEGNGAKSRPNETTAPLIVAYADRVMHKRASLGFSLLLILPACGETSGSSDDEVGTETQADGSSDTSNDTTSVDSSDASTDSATDTADTTDTTDPTDTTDTTDTGADFGPARGITIVSVEANQGVGVPIGVGAEIGRASCRERV